MDDEIDLMEKHIGSKLVENQLVEYFSLTTVTTQLDSNNICESRDIFNARLDNLYQFSKNALLAAVCGEIGNNSFDHNLGNWHDIVGVYLDYDSINKTIVIADRGQGIRKTLSRVLPDLASDNEALDIAFKKTISGRSPEQRGNGLKFVSKSILNNNWSLKFYSGRSFVSINQGEMIIGNFDKTIIGCLAIVKY